MRRPWRKREMEDDAEQRGEASSLKRPAQASSPPPPPPPPPPLPPPESGELAQPGSSAVTPQRVNGIAVTALVLGIIGVLAGLIPILFFMAWSLGVLALAFGLIGSANARRRGNGKAIAISGAILGAVALALGVVGIIIVNDVFASTKKAIEHTTVPTSPNVESTLVPGITQGPASTRVPTSTRVPATARVPATTRVRARNRKTLDIRTVDFGSRQYTLNCGEPNQAVTLSDRTWQDPRGRVYGAVIGMNVQYGDATGRSGIDAVVEIDCSAGASGSFPNVLVYTVRNNAPTEVGHLEGQKPVIVEPGRVGIWNPRLQANEPRCCPTQFERVVHQYDGQSFVPVETTVHTTAEFQAAPG